MQKRLAERFVATVHSDALPDRSGPDIAFLRAMKEQSAKSGGPTFQGCYAITPSGVLLASANSATEPATIVRMLDTAWQKWQTLSPAQRRRATDTGLAPAALPEWAPERHYPKGGLVLRVSARFLPDPAIPDPWSGYLNSDYAWFWKDEAAGFVPVPATKGVKRDVPRGLIERLARCHLDGPFGKDEVVEARLTSEVMNVAKNGIVSLRLSGATKTERKNRDGDKPGVGSIAVATQLVGRALWNPAEQKFLSFELLGKGARRGAPEFWNLKEKGDRSWPVGFALSLAPDTPAVRQTPPYYYWSYHSPERPGY